MREHPSGSSAVPEPEGLRIEVDGGVRLNGLRYGPADHRPPDLVLVPGLASNALLWDGVATALAAAGHRVLAIDQRAHGRSDPSDDLDVATLTDDLLRCARAVGFDRPVLVGQSWGGNVVLAAARHHPERIRAVVGVDGGTIDLPARFPDWERCWAALAPPRWDQGARFDELSAAAPARAAAEGWPDGTWRARLGNLAVRADGTVTAILTRARHEAIVRGMWDHPPSLDHPHVEVPVLLLPVESPDPERLEAKRASVDAALAVLPRGRVHWFVDRVHDVHAQAPDEVAAALLAAIDDGFLLGDGP